MGTATTRKVEELEGAELDYWVAKAEEWPLRLWPPGHAVTLDEWREAALFAPSTQRDHGGPIIEREGIAVYRLGGDWRAMHPKDCDGGWYGKSALEVGACDGFGGDTPLIAAMRCFVAFKFGAEVDE